MEYPSGGLLGIALRAFWYVCWGILVLWWLEPGHRTRTTTFLSCVLQQCSSHPETGLLPSSLSTVLPKDEHVALRIEAGDYTISSRTDILVIVRTV